MRVCRFVCVCETAGMCVYVYGWVGVGVYETTGMCVYVYGWVCVRLQGHVSTWVWLGGCVCERLQGCVSICIWLGGCVCVCVCVKLTGPSPQEQEWAGPSPSPSRWESRRWSRWTRGRPARVRWPAACARRMELRWTWTCWTMVTGPLTCATLRSSLGATHSACASGVSWSPTTPFHLTVSPFPSLLLLLSWDATH